MKDLYSPKRQLRLFEQNGQTILIGEDSKPVASALAKQLKAEASSLLTTHLWPIMIENLRADAVKIGIVDYTKEEHALYGKAIFYVLEMMEKTVAELAALQIESDNHPTARNMS